VATVLGRVKKVVVSQLGVDNDQVNPDTSLVDDLNADSLDLMELIVALEEEFSGGNDKLEIPDEDVQSLSTVQQVVDYIKSHGVVDE